MARSFTASTDAVEYTTNIAATTAMSFCVWVKNPIATGTAAKLLGCQEDQWRVSLNAEKYGGGTPTAGSLYFGRSWGSTDQATQVASPGVTWANWNHIAVTYDGAATGNAAKFYANGVLLTNSFTRNAAGSIDNAIGNPNLGNDNAHAKSCQGIMAYGSMHNLVLTQAEVLEHMVTGHTGRGRFVDWELTGDSPELDRSGNGRSGTVTGTTIAAGPPVRRGTVFVPAEWTKSSVTAVLFIQAVTATAAGTASAARGITKTVTRSAAGTASLARRAGKSAAASASGTPLLVRQIRLTRSVTAAGTPSLVRRTAKALATSTVGTASITAAATLRRTITATALGTASMSRRAGKAVATSASGSASMTRRAGAVMAASAVGSASIATLKVILFTLTATASGTASLARRTARSMAASAAAAPSMVRQTRHTITRSVTGAPTLAKRTAKRLAATSTGTATLAKMKVTLLTITAAAVGTATIVKRSAKTLAVTASGAASMTKTAAKTVAASSAVAPTLATLKVFLVTLSATATASASFAKRLTLSLLSQSTGSPTLAALFQPVGPAVPGIADVRGSTRPSSGVRGTVSVSAITRGATNPATEVG